MEDFIREFKDHSYYSAYATVDMIKPNVSWCVTEDEVHYKPAGLILYYDIVQATSGSGPGDDAVVKSGNKSIPIRTTYIFYLKDSEIQKFKDMGFDNPIPRCIVFNKFGDSPIFELDAYEDVLGTGYWTLMLTIPKGLMNPKTEKMSVMVCEPNPDYNPESIGKSANTDKEFLKTLLVKAYAKYKKPLIVESPVIPVRPKSSGDDLK